MGIADQFAIDAVLDGTIGPELATFCEEINGGVEWRRKWCGIRRGAFSPEAAQDPSPFR